MPETKVYVTTKIVRAFAARHRDDDRDGYTIIYPDGYQSWCPKDEFERTSRELSDDDKRLI